MTTNARTIVRRILDWGTAPSATIPSAGYCKAWRLEDEGAAHDRLSLTNVSESRRGFHRNAAAVLRKLADDLRQNPPAR